MKLIFQTMLIILWLLQPMTLFADSPLNIQVSILPQKYFVDRLARDKAVVKVLVKPGKNPATYSPSPSQIKTLSESDLYFRIGVPFENGFIHKIGDIARKIKIVDTRQGIRLRQMKAHFHDHHSGEHQDNQPVKIENNDDTEGKDPHIWLNPVLVKQQAHTITQALIAADPENRSFYETNLEIFLKDMDDLHLSILSALMDFKGKNLFVFHPSFGYFTDAYHLNQVAIETMGKAPKGKALTTLIKLARKEKASVIFVQPQFDRNAAQKIASAIKGTVVPIDPLAYDYPANMKQMAAVIAEHLK